MTINANHAQAGVRELRQDASKLLKRVKNGETIEITQNGKPVALLTPIPVSDWEAAIELGLLIPPTSPTNWRSIKTFKSNIGGTTLERLLADRAVE